MKSLTHILFAYINTAVTLLTSHTTRLFFLSFVSSLISDKSVSFEKSVSFSDDIQGVSKAHSPQHMGKSLSLKITSV